MNMTREIFKELEYRLYKKLIRDHRYQETRVSKILNITGILYEAGSVTQQIVDTIQERAKHEFN